MKENETAILLLFFSQKFFIFYAKGYDGLIANILRFIWKEITVIYQIEWGFKILY